jgi:N utilization substance protein B
MGRRRQAREAALKLLYAFEFSKSETDPRTMLRAPWVSDLIPQAVRDFTEALVIGTLAHRDDIDSLIQAASMHWSLDRIGLVERNILRFAIYELLYLPDIPARVTMNEAVEVAKKYGAAEASVFINGILDRISHDAMSESQVGEQPAPKPQHRPTPV